MMSTLWSYYFRVKNEESGVGKLRNLSKTIADCKLIIQVLKGFLYRAEE